MFYKMTTLLAFCLALISTSCRGDNTMVFLREYLNDEGAKLDCYFTIEGVLSEKGGSSLALNKRIVPQGEIRNTDELAVKLAAAFKDVEVKIVRSKNNPTVFHIVDKRLTEVKDIPLEKRKTVEYSGSPDGLISHLNKEDSAISKKRSRALGSGQIVLDFKTPITVSAKEDVLRDVLTDCLPLSEYQRVLWISITDLKSTSRKTTIEYQGPDRNKKE